MFSDVNAEMLLSKSIVDFTLVLAFGKLNGTDTRVLEECW
jgi:hypothetical protein